MSFSATASLVMMEMLAFADKQWTKMHVEIGVSGDAPGHHVSPVALFTLAALALGAFQASLRTEQLHFSSPITSTPFLTNLFLIFNFIFSSWFACSPSNLAQSWQCSALNHFLSPTRFTSLALINLVFLLLGVWAHIATNLVEVVATKEQAMHVATVARQVASKLPPELVAKFMGPHSDAIGAEKTFASYLSLADDVSRECRTYDTNTAGFIHMLMDTRLTKLQEELLGNLQRSLAYSSRVIQNSILYFKADSGILAMDMTSRFTAQDAFDKALGEQKGILENNMGVNVIRRIDPNFPALRGEFHYLTSIIEFLLDNAAKFTVQGLVTLSAKVINTSTAPLNATYSAKPNLSSPNSSSKSTNMKDTNSSKSITQPSEEDVEEPEVGHVTIELCVQDTGCGIPAAQIPILKAPFSTKSEQFWSAKDTRGAGLGIPTADCLARSFPDGRLGIESTEGVGTAVTFRCTLPIDTEHVVEQFGLERSKDGSRGRPIKIAVCAHEPTYTTILGMLAPHGFEVKQILPGRNNTDNWFEVRQAGLRHEPFKAVLIDALVLGTAPYQAEGVYALAGQLKNDPVTANIQTALLIHAGYYMHDTTKADVFNEGILKPLLYQHVTAIVRRMIGESYTPIIDSRSLPIGLDEEDMPDFLDHHSAGHPAPLLSSRKRRYSAPMLTDIHSRGDSIGGYTDASSSGSSHSLLADLPESPDSSPRSVLTDGLSIDGVFGGGKKTRIQRARTTVDASTIHAVLANSAAMEVKLHVLVVEDDGTNRLVLNRMISQAGHTCVGVDNGQDGVDYYAKHRGLVDMIIMDYRMPHMDGFQATALIRQYEESHNLPRVEIIALTADEGLRPRCIAAGMDECWTKPVKAQLLHATLLERAAKRAQKSLTVPRSSSTSPISTSTTANPRHSAPPTTVSPLPLPLLTSGMNPHTPNGLVHASSAPLSSSQPPSTTTSPASSLTTPLPPLTISGSLTSSNAGTDSSAPLGSSASSPTPSVSPAPVPTSTANGSPSTSPNITSVSLPALPTAQISANNAAAAARTSSADSTSPGANPSSSTPRVPSRSSRKALVPPTGSEPMRSDYILLVEDNATVAKIATTVLERNNQKVEHVPDGQEAFEKITREHSAFSIVLMDIHLPKLSGFECTELIRDFENQHNLPPLYIIALTGDQHIDSEKYRSKGFNNFLRKPLNYPSLIAELPHMREQHAASAKAIAEASSSSSSALTSS
jgi:CheY-like chemotaxis protein/signal transduction histidine kinase